MAYEETNIGGAQSILNFADQIDIDVFIYGSVFSVYGNRTDVPFSEENDVGKSISPCVATKW